MIYLELLDCLTGENLLAQLHAFDFPPTYVSLIQYDSPEMLALRVKVDDKFYPIVYMLFDKLGEIDSEITMNLKPIDKESWQYISFNSLCSKMHTVFGIKNVFFAKMFFLFLSSGRPLNTRINFQMWLEKLMPFWVKAPSDVIYTGSQALIESVA
jgi:hypothetical protein